MSKKMPKKMRARHTRTRKGGDPQQYATTHNVKITSKYGNENIEDSPMSLTPKNLEDWKTRNGRM